MKSKMHSITILTPTFNRAHTLNKLYKSLCKQTNKNFEWMVVDDGSNDNTEENSYFSVIFSNIFQNL